MRRTGILTISALLLCLGSAAAGPPCLCWPLEVGDAPTLRVEDRSPASVAEEALALLRPSLPVLARMEVLRRAAIALQGHPALVERVVGRLCARVLDVETGLSQNPGRAWFDAGYAVEAFHQAGMLNRMGYDWLARGILKAPEQDRGAMHLGAAMAALMPRHPRHLKFQMHLQAAREAAPGDALLAKNLKSFSEHFASLSGDTPKQDR